METLPSKDTSHADPSESARERLLEAAFGVFAERGFAGTSTREICRRAGANSAALNYHWGSKDKLWLAVTHRCANLFEEALAQALGALQSPEQLIERLIDAVFELLQRDPRPVRIVLWATLQAETLDYDAAVRAFDPIVERCIQALGAMRSAQLIAANVDVEVAGPLLYSQIMYAFADGAGHRRYYGRDLGDPEHAARFRAELVRSAHLALGVRRCQ